MFEASVNAITMILKLMQSGGCLPIDTLAAMRISDFLLIRQIAFKGFSQAQGNSIKLFQGLIH